MSTGFQSTGAILRPFGASANFQRWDGTWKTGERQPVVGLYLSFEQVKALGLDPDQPIEVALRNVTNAPATPAETPATVETPAETPAPAPAEREAKPRKPRKQWTPAPWHAAALADYREARLVWEQTRDAFSKGYANEAAEFAELYPSPRLADFVSEHAARLRAERGDDTAPEAENAA